MKNILTVLAIVVLAWLAYSRLNKTSDSPTSEPSRVGFIAESPADSPNTSPQFTCDGRTHCSQMTSCEEATYFLQNCPGVKMDGNGDGEPCESQWCDSSQ